MKEKKVDVYLGLQYTMLSGVNLNAFYDAADHFVT